MAYTPISNTVPQYSKNAAGASAAGYYLKFYADGTTTPISMATDSSGGTLLAKCELDSLGYPTTDGTNIFIPHIDQTYKLALYTNATDADNNTLASATWVVDDLKQQAVIEDLTTIKNFATLAAAVADTNLLDGDALNIAERTAGNGGGAMWDVVLSSTVTEDTFSIVQCTGVGTLSLVLRVDGSLTPKQIGADGGGVVDDILALNAFSAYARDNGVTMLGGGSDCYYRISSEWVIDHECDFDGQMCQIFQETTNANGVIFDKGSNMNAVNARRIVCGTVAGTGDAFTFRNCNESNFTDLFVPGCGNIAFHNEGSLLSNFLHLEASNGLRVTPSWNFLGESALAHVDGIKHSSLNGLSPNVNTYTRCSCTNSTGVAYNIDKGAGNVFDTIDAEDIQTPAIHMILNDQTTVRGGNLEGTGGGLQVNADNCDISGMNGLSGIVLAAGVYGCHVRDSLFRSFVINSGTSHCVIENITIGAGGFISGVQSGTNNIVQNVYDGAFFESFTATASQTVFPIATRYIVGAGRTKVKIDNVETTAYTETDDLTITLDSGATLGATVDIFPGRDRGLNRSGSFSPTLEFGGGSTGATYTQQRGEYIITPHGGGMCYFKVQLQIGTKSTDTGVATVDLGDIPFAAKDDTLDTLVEIKLSGVPTGAGNYPSANLTYNTKTIKLQSVADSTGTVGNLDDTDFTTGDTIWLTGWYFI